MYQKSRMTLHNYSLLCTTSGFKISVHIILQNCKSTESFRETLRENTSSIPPYNHRIDLVFSHVVPGDPKLLYSSFSVSLDWTTEFNWWIEAHTSENTKRGCEFSCCICCSFRYIIRGTAYCASHRKYYSQIRVGWRATHTRYPRGHYCA